METPEQKAARLERRKTWKPPPDDMSKDEHPHTHHEKYKNRVLPFGHFVARGNHPEAISVDLSVADPES